MSIMPPTVQNGGADKRGLARPAEKRLELICKVKYCNTLPDIAFDPKFISYPFDTTRFIQYNPTSLERNHKYEVLTEHDLGVEIDLINRDTYNCDLNSQLDPADEKLLEEDILTPQDSQRSRHHARSVSWLRRTEYISTEQTRFQPTTTSDKVEAKVGHNIKKHFKDETLYMDHESQMRAITKTFEDNKKPIEKHHSKPNVHAIEVFAIFPDFKLWKYPCAQVIFDSDPAPMGISVPAQIEEMSQAMIRGVMDESGEQFVAYFLPVEETLEKRKRDFCSNIEYAEEEEYEYKMAREYNWNIKSKASKGYEENYFFVIRENDGVYYNELETRVRLNKRRQKTGLPVNNTRLIVKHRPLNSNEFRMQRFREKQLEPPCDDDEEEEEDEEEETQLSGGKMQKKDSDDENEENESEKENEDGSRVSSRASSQASSQKSGSRARSRSPSKARSTRSRSVRSTRSARSTSKSQSLSRSNSRSPSGSPAKSHSRSRSGSREKSHSRSRSGSPAESSRSGSPARSRSKSTSRSRSVSKSKSRSRSRSKSETGSEGSGSSSGSGGSESGSESE